MTCFAGTLRTKQVEINVDYILMPVEKWREARGNGTDKEVEAVANIRRAVDAGWALRNKKDLIMDFVDRVSASGKIDAEWRAYVDGKRSEELDAIISDEGLKPEETRAFVEHAFLEGAIPTTGTAVTKILPSVSRFAPDGGHGMKKQRQIGRQSAPRGELGSCGVLVQGDHEAEPVGPARHAGRQTLRRPHGGATLVANAPRSRLSQVVRHRSVCRSA